MTMQISLEDKYIDKFKEFVDSLPTNAIKVNNIKDNSISMDEAKEKVKKSIDNISLNQGLDLDTAFSKVESY